MRCVDGLSNDQASLSGERGRGWRPESAGCKRAGWPGPTRDGGTVLDAPAALTKRAGSEEGTHSACDVERVDQRNHAQRPSPSPSSSPFVPELPLPFLPPTVRLAVVKRRPTALALPTHLFTINSSTCSLYLRLSENMPLCVCARRGTRTPLCACVDGGSTQVHGLRVICASSVTLEIQSHIIGASPTPPALLYDLPF